MEKTVPKFYLFGPVWSVGFETVLRMEQVLETGIDEAAEGLCGQGDAVIRQAISCDICGTEKKQTNHWFVSSEQGGELRVSGWSSRNRLRPGSKHLCGQTCLHKLVDEFMARALLNRVQPSVEECDAEAGAVATDTSLTALAAHAEVESCARLLTPVLPVLTQKPPFNPPVELVAMPGRLHAEASAPGPVLDEPNCYAPRSRRAEAWDRERERALRTDEQRMSIAARRRSGS
jgi:hypothetical protein